ncbi:hypothetical protein [Acidiluteibacter ferrifornacis]|uniref:Uncharacterized protein n=1 Tax=Acidiluteibacter ferrifornacis TaxID=2692424 RepID=A0A6N9NPW5_9FLAO|nr:hypothetical protein [Acidiluteibacter ferrifornacis]NBG67330.1 hypothetical protein [Acidiluteibacter ferrifornacis]
MSNKKSVNDSIISLVKPLNDTVYLSVDVSGNTDVTFPETLVNIEAQKKETWDYWFEGITLVGVFVTILFTILSIKKLLKKSEENSQLLEQLVNQNKLKERHIKMESRPDLTFSTTCNPTEMQVYFHSRDNEVREIELTKLSGNAEMQPKNKANRKIIGSQTFDIMIYPLPEIQVKEVELEFKLEYRDKAGYQYIRFYKLENRKLTLLNEIEL